VRLVAVESGRYAGSHVLELMLRLIGKDA
jgi:hypothetical protein